MKKILTIGILLITSTALAQENPNIVFILADDMGWDHMGAYGNDFYQTPNLDELAESGMRFTDAYSAPVCSPARAAIITGKSSARLHLTSHIPSMMEGFDEHGRTDELFNTLMDGPPSGNWLPLEHTSIAEAVGKQGHVPGFIGKWHLGHEPYHPVEQGFDVQIGVTNLGQPPSYYYPYQRDGLRIKDLEGDAEERYLTDRLTDEGIKFLKKHKAKPFFLYMSYYTPHTPIEPKEKDFANYKDRISSVSRRVARYAAMITTLDHSVGKIMTALEDLELRDNTLVVFLSDNGGYLDMDSLRGAKGSLYEGGIRVPMFASWPGVIEAGSVSNEPIISTDMFPTFLDATGGDPDNYRDLDGMSLMPLFRGEIEILDREALHWHFPHYRWNSDWPMGGAIRQRHYKLIQRYDSGEIELYDLSEDLLEQNNLVDEKPEVAQKLQLNLYRWLEREEAGMPKDAFILKTDVHE